MRLHCPHCGDRDSREFEYLGAASLLNRPESDAQFQDYIYSRENSAGDTAELWQHTMGCRAWLHVVRNTTTHAVKQVRLARDVREETR